MIDAINDDRNMDYEKGTMKLQNWRSLRYRCMRKKNEGGENVERWVIALKDFLTGKEGERS